MKTPRMSFTLAVLLLASFLAGCAQPGPLGQRRVTLGTLKTSVAQLEYQNRKLNQDLADSRAEVHRLDERLAQEEAANGDLAAQLDDYRSGTMTAGAPPQTQPVKRPVRKPPVAQIPGRIEPIPIEEMPEEERTSPLPGSLSPAPRGLEPQSRRDETLPWLPVARGNLESAGRVR